MILHQMLWCNTCYTNVMNLAEFHAHMFEVHNLQPDQLRGDSVVVYEAMDDTRKALETLWRVNGVHFAEAKITQRQGD